MAILYICRDLNVTDPLLSAAESLRQHIAVLHAQENNREALDKELLIYFTEDEGLAEVHFTGDIGPIVELLTELYDYGMCPSLVIDVHPTELEELDSLLASMKWKDLPTIVVMEGDNKNG